MPDQTFVSPPSLHWIDEEMARLGDAGLLANIRTIESPMDAWVTIDGRPLLNFCANNYLGLANDPRLRAAAKEAIDRYGIGPGAVRTIAGTMSLHLELEQQLAEFKRLGSLHHLPERLLRQHRRHPGPGRPGRHHLLRRTEPRLASSTAVASAGQPSFAMPTAMWTICAARSRPPTEYGRRLIITDGVFSMDGDIAPLDKICDVAEEHDIVLMVDDAHGEGVLGRGGRGIVDHFGLHGRVHVEVGTLSKAFGVVGGLVAGNRIDRRVAAPARASLPLLQRHDRARRGRLHRVGQHPERVDRTGRPALAQCRDSSSEACSELGFDTGHTQTPIVPVMLGDAPLAQAFSRRLFEEGLFAMAIGFPTVPMGKARIRVMNSAAHSETIWRALDFWRGWGGRWG